MVWAELDQPGQERQRDFVGKMLLDILRQLLSLPPGELPMLVRFKRGAALVQPHQLVRQRDAEHFDIGALGSDGCCSCALSLKTVAQISGSKKNKCGLRSTSAKPSSESDDGP